ncbi:HAD-IIA family hydrolase [Thermoclostridium stercorarium]|uniref:HAD-IIA family hydrolase n=1 Tax=Thermoclostridium stercorarium TaxID=1510 RepID=UPI0002C5AF96|nr:HAD-IIA family hydrolase [Thermoclostridium stercorarium]AGI38859.1 sugar phosphatase [Thermoclostridium stercorarium subsp. stercorarium DSM 8532]
MVKESILKTKKLFVLDMDGTFYLGDRLIDGSLDFIKKLEATGKQYLFFTNNSSKTSDFYIKKLASMGLNITKDRILTSGDVTINYLKKYYNGKRIYLMATEIVEKEFLERGINLCTDDADAVVVAFDTSLTYEKLNIACKLIRNGSDFIATHPDFNCPTEDGFIPDCGAMCAFITASTGKKPKYLGKPYKETVDCILDHTGLTVDDIVFVGDRLYTDIATAYYHGATGLLVLSGETKLKDLENSDVKPDLIFESLKEVAEVL